MTHGDARGVLAAGPLNPVAPGAAGLWQHDLTRICQRVKGQRSMPAGIVDLAVEEYRRYMALILLNDRNYAMFSEEVDEVWHAHLLFSRDYEHFCVANFGRFIHHEPTDPEAADLGQAWHAWRAFQSAYQRSFGALSFLWGPGPAGPAELSSSA